MIVIDRPGSGDETIRLETIKHAGIIYLQIIEENRSDAETSALHYKLEGAGGTMAPAWLRQVGPYTFAGQPVVGSGVVDLVLSIVERDGQVFQYDIRLDSFTGHLSQPERSEDHGTGDGWVPMFSEQLNGSAPGQSLTRLEEALGFRRLLSPP